MYIIILLLYRQRILYPPSVLWLASPLGHTFGEFASVYTLHQDLQWGSCTILIMLPDFLMLTRISDLSWKNYSVWTSGCIPLRILVWLEWHISQTRKIIVSFMYIYGFNFNVTEKRLQILGVDLLMWLIVEEYYYNNN